MFVVRVFGAFKCITNGLHLQMGRFLFSGACFTATLAPLDTCRLAFDPFFLSGDLFISMVFN